jgi:phage gp36-like protein
MAYITNNDIESRLGTAAYVQCADDDGDGVANAGVVDEVRLAAEGEVNSHLGQRYGVPVDLTVHAELADVLRSITLDIAEYRLRARRPPASAESLRRYNDTIAWLRNIAAGVAELPSSEALPANPAYRPFAAGSSEPRLLSRDELSRH